MEISKKLDYALRMLSEVAKADEGQVVSVRQVSDSDNIPYAFARTIQHEMVKAGLLLTTRGPRGGMKLAVDPRVITLRKIVEAIDGPMPGSVGDLVDDDLYSGRFAPLWKELHGVIYGYLDSVTLSQLAVEGLMPTTQGKLDFELVSLNEG